MVTDRLPPARAIQPPYAAILQGHWDLADVAMLQAAQLRRPGIRWWWGARVVGADRYAWCYLCDRRVCDVTAGRTITRHAADSLGRHRLQHVALGDTIPGNDAGATMASADAPPTGGQE